MMFEEQDYPSNFEIRSSSAKTWQEKVEEYEKAFGKIPSPQKVEEILNQNFKTCKNCKQKENE